MHNTREYIIYELVCIRAWILYHSTNSLYAYSLVLYYEQLVLSREYIPNMLILARTVNNTTNTWHIDGAIMQ